MQAPIPAQAQLLSTCCVGLLGGRLGQSSSEEQLAALKHLVQVQPDSIPAEACPAVLALMLMSRSAGSAAGIFSPELGYLRSPSLTAGDRVPCRWLLAVQRLASAA